MKGTRVPRPRPHPALKPKDLRWECNAARLGFETTDELEFKPNIIGQDRALDAIRLGLALRSAGYNIFVSGLTGTGKLTAIRYMLEGMDLRRDDLDDICYVYNFAAEDTPVCLILPAGKASQLRAHLKELLRSIVDLIPTALQSERFKREHAKIADEVKERRDEMLQALTKQVTEKGFSLVEVEYEGFTRPEILPLVAGEPTPVDRLPSLLAQGKLKEGDYHKYQAAYPNLARKLDEFLLAARDLARSLEQRTADLERLFITPVIDAELKRIGARFDSGKVERFLQDLRSYVLDHLPAFVVPKAEVEKRHKEFLPFEVNVLVDNAGRREAPVVIETSPTFGNVFGTIERYVSADGGQASDHMAIRGGSLLRANGGYLIMNMIDVLEEPMVWVTLKRVLKSQRHTIRGFDSFLLMPIASIKPEAILLDIKVVLIGDAWMYQALWDYDEDFRASFKVKADFDSVMPNTLANQKRYCRFVRVVTRVENLPAFHRTACAAIIEEGTRIAGRRDRLSTRFSEIGDVVREAAHWAMRAGAKTVRPDHVAKAIAERVRRVSLVEDKLQEMYDDGSILLDTKGAKVGQVNGLAVYDLGDHVFARPSRITAETGVGRAGIINIERESEMSGRIHNKGVLILEGYLRRMYAQDKPITVTASLCFEQGYSFVEGDSASSSEIYALLSSLAAVPLRQDIAVTGSINQKGEIQPIGGVNEKIEGFYDVCMRRGLTGRQGVMIPVLNTPELMLRRDVVDAVKKNKFHVYAVRTVDEGIEVLTNRRAGQWIPRRGFELNSMHELVDRGLRHYHDRLRDAEDGSTEAAVAAAEKKAKRSKTPGAPKKPPKKPPRKPPRRRRNKREE
jgi:lon-related putative ATP-dependent protease